MFTYIFLHISLNILFSILVLECFFFKCHFLQKGWVDDSEESSGFCILKSDVIYVCCQTCFLLGFTGILGTVEFHFLMFL